MKINAIRTARGYSQEYLASQLGISQVMLSKIEKDEVKKLDNILLENIALKLGVSVQDIISPTPIIMNFHNSPQSGQYNHYQMDKKMMEALLD